MRWPRTKVPLALPRSSMKSWPPLRASTRVPARDLRVRDDDVVVRRAADRPVLRRRPREVELPDDRLVLLRRAGWLPAAAGAGCATAMPNDFATCRRSVTGSASGPSTITMRGSTCTGLLRRDPRLADRHAARRSEIGDRHAIARERRVLRRDRGVLDHEVALAPDRVRRAAGPGAPGAAPRHQHETDRGMRERNLRLPDRERCLQIERHRLARRYRPPAARRRPLSVVDEDERPLPW